MSNLGLKWCFSSPTCFGAKWDMLEDVSPTAACSSSGKTGIKVKKKKAFVGDKESSR